MNSCNLDAYRIVRRKIVPFLLITASAFLIFGFIQKLFWFQFIPLQDLFDIVHLLFGSYRSISFLIVLGITVWFVIGKGLGQKRIIGLYFIECLAGFLFLIPLLNAAWLFVMGVFTSVFFSYCQLQILWQSFDVRFKNVKHAGLPWFFLFLIPGLAATVVWWPLFSEFPLLIGILLFNIILSECTGGVFLYSVNQHKSSLTEANWLFVIKDIACRGLIMAGMILEDWA